MLLRTSGWMYIFKLVFSLENTQEWNFWILARPYEIYFYFLRKLHTILHSICTSLHSHQPCRRVSFFAHSLLIDSLPRWSVHWCKQGVKVLLLLLMIITLNCWVYVAYLRLVLFFFWCFILFLYLECIPL